MHEDRIAGPSADPGRAPVLEPAPFWAIAVVTWLNSIGSGLLWSGVPFVTKHDFGFSAAENLVLSAAASAVYVAFAFAGGRLVQRLAARVAARTVLAVALAVELATGTLAFGGAASVVVCALLTSAVGATLWPIIESYLSSGRHGAPMRRAIGVFNVVWMSATAVALVLMSPLLEGGHSRLALAALVPVAAISLVVLRWFPPRPAPHDESSAAAHVPTGYRSLLRSTRWLLPMSYLIVGALGPLMPYFVGRLGVAPAAETPLTATWMIARLLAAVAITRTSSWHGRWSMLALGAALMLIGFAAVVLASDVAVLGAGLFALGAGQGTIYCAGLYYALAVGRAGVAAGGAFEAVIGLGYIAGPLAALLGSACGGGAATVAAVWIAAGAALVPAARAFQRRRSRGRSASVG